MHSHGCLRWVSGVAMLRTGWGYRRLQADVFPVSFFGFRGRDFHKRGQEDDFCGVWRVPEWCAPGPRPSVVIPSPGTSTLRHCSGGFAACSGDPAAYFGVLLTRGLRVCGAKIFLRVNLLWWRESKLRHVGQYISAPEGSGNLAAFSCVLSSSVYAAACVRNTWTLCGGSRC